MFCSDLGLSNVQALYRVGDTGHRSRDAIHLATRTLDPRLTAERTSFDGVRHSQVFGMGHTNGWVRR